MDTGLLPRFSVCAQGHCDHRCSILFEILLSVLWGGSPAVEMLGHAAILFSFLRSAMLFSIAAITFLFPPARHNKVLVTTNDYL